MRRLVLSIGLALSLSALGASSALAEAPEGAQKAPLFGPESIGFLCFGGTPTAETFGFVVLNTPGNESTLTGEVVLKRAAPNTTYNVADLQSQGGTSCAGAFRSGQELHTNRQGNGTVKFSVERDPGFDEFSVAVSTGQFPINNAFISPAVELD
jgi:hypothetical protein